MKYRLLNDTDKIELILMEMGVSQDERYYDTPRDYKKVLDKDIQGVVAEENDDICGYTFGYIVDNKFYIEYTFVDQNHRNKGIYTELAKKLDELVKTLSVEAICLHTKHNNEPIKKIRQRMGYAIIKTITGFYRKWHIDAVYMEKTM